MDYKLIFEQMGQKDQLLLLPLVLLIDEDIS
jgi:hypothetical protein